MEEFVTADLLKPGDIIKCICEQGCVKPDTCQQMHCKNDPCNTTPQGTWEKVLHVAIQPATNSDWFYFTLTHNKEFGTWGKNLVIRFKPD
jgi:hypothetical protein